MKPVVKIIGTLFVFLFVSTIAGCGGDSTKQNPVPPEPIGGWGPQAQIQISDTETQQDNQGDGQGDGQGEAYIDDIELQETDAEFDNDFGHISSMICGDDPDYVYAIDYTNYKFYKIQISPLQVVTTVDLDYQPWQMVYSKTKDSIYICGNNYDNGEGLTIYDIQNDTTSSVADIGATSIAIDDVAGRLYLLNDSQYLSIYDIENITGLSTTSIVGTTCVLGSGQNYIFTSMVGGLALRTFIVKYSVNDDEPELVAATNYDEFPLGAGLNMLSISPDGKHLLAPSNTDSVSDGTPKGGLFDINTSDLTGLYGQWETGHTVNSAKFSHDQQLVFCEGEDILQVFNAKSYQLITQVDSPIEVFTLNSTGTVLVGLSESTDKLYSYSIK